MFLLVLVTLISGSIALAASLFETTPSIAEGARPQLASRIETQPPVRVIVPFTPNINPAAR